MPDTQIESVGLGATLVMAGFVLMAVVIAASIVCKVLFAVGLAPRRQDSLVRWALLRVANVVGEVRVVRGRGARRGGRSSSRGGGGSSGGAGASGEF